MKDRNLNEKRWRQRVIHKRKPYGEIKDGGLHAEEVTLEKVGDAILSESLISPISSQTFERNLINAFGKRIS